MIPFKEEDKGAQLDMNSTNRELHNLQTKQEKLSEELNKYERQEAYARQKLQELVSVDIQAMDSDTLRIHMKEIRKYVSDIQIWHEQSDRLFDETQNLKEEAIQLADDVLKRALAYEELKAEIEAFDFIDANAVVHGNLDEQIDVQYDLLDDLSDMVEEAEKTLRKRK